MWKRQKIKEMVKKKKEKPNHVQYVHVFIQFIIEKE